MRQLSIAEPQCPAKFRVRLSLSHFKLRANQMNQGIENMEVWLIGYWHEMEIIWSLKEA